MASFSKATPFTLRINKFIETCLNQGMSIEEIKKEFGKRYKIDMNIRHETEQFVGASFNYVDKYKFRDQWEAVFRDCRGTFILIDKCNKTVVDVLYNMSRGPEVCTGVTGTEETDDMDDRNPNPTLMAHYGEIIKSCQNKTEFTQEAFLSMKRDGSLLGVSVVSGDLREFFEDWIQNGTIDKHAKPFHQMCVELCREEPYLVVIGSRSIPLVGPDMLTYFVGSILCGLKMTTEEELMGKKPVDFWKRHGKAFIDRCIELVRRSDMPSNSYKLCFEAICKNRQDAFTGRIHIELVVDYKQSILSMLSISAFDGTIAWKPHFELPVEELFDQPLVWKISTGADVHAIMEALSLWMRQQITTTEFLEQFKPYTGYGESPYIDPEGFVGLFKDDSGDWVYVKMKTPEYYAAHKCRDPVAVLELSRCVGHLFPAVKHKAETRVQMPEWLEKIVREFADLAHSTFTNLQQTDTSAMPIADQKRFAGVLNTISSAHTFADKMQKLIEHYMVGTTFRQQFKQIVVDVVPTMESMSVPVDIKKSNDGLFCKCFAMIVEAHDVSNIPEWFEEQVLIADSSVSAFVSAYKKAYISCA